MKTIETTIVIDESRLATLQFPADVAPGTHRVVVVIEESPAFFPNAPTLDDFPVIDVGPWPDDLSMRREDMYGDNGR